jgi:hypothetical protein
VPCASARAELRMPRHARSRAAIAQQTLDDSARVHAAFVVSFTTSRITKVLRGASRADLVDRNYFWWTKNRRGSLRWKMVDQKMKTVDGNSAQSTALGNRGPKCKTVDEKSAQSTAPEKMAPDFLASHHTQTTDTTCRCSASSTNTRHTGSLKAGSLWHEGCHRSFREAVPPALLSRLVDQYVSVASPGAPARLEPPP